MAADRERVASAAFLTGSLLAGGNAVGVRFSNRELAPLWGAGLRFLVAAALLWQPWWCCDNHCRTDAPSLVR